MKQWTQWERVRHQVAVCGCVFDVAQNPVAGAQVTISEMPDAFKAITKRATCNTGSTHAEQDQRLDQTLSRSDGLFYFLDLPTGKYRITVVDRKSQAQGDGRFSVAYAKDGSVIRAAKDVNLKPPETQHRSVS